MDYYRRGVITLETALANCSNATQFELKVKGIEGASDTTWVHVGAGGKKE
jgi:hypothetical protein